jgi:DNA-binding IclR family transcriptional regulator
MTAAGGVAILVALQEAEMRQVVEWNLQDVTRYGTARVRSLEKVFRESRKQGFGIHQGQITPGVHALGLAVFRWDGKPFASLSVVGSADALPPSQTRQVLALLRDETRQLAREADRLNLAI